MKYNQVRKVILYKFHVLMIISILKINSENKLIGFNHWQFNVSFNLAF